MLDTETTVSAPGRADDSAAWYDALTLKERSGASLVLDAKCVSGQGEHLEQGIFRLERWKELAPFQQYQELFAERLALEDLAEEQLFALLVESTIELRARVAPPAWLDALEQALSVEQEGLLAFLATTGLSAELLQQCRQTFEHSLLAPVQPLILAGVRRLHTALGELGQALPLPCDQTQALLLWLQNLPARLLPLVSRVLTLELHIARLEGRLQGKSAEERFQSFTALFSTREQREAWLREYAPLARLVNCAIGHWVDYGLEFFRHLGEDWSELRAMFSSSEEAGTLVEVKCGLGDQHRQGRSTILLRFSSHLRLVYKPRSMRVDQHFQELLTWLNEQGRILPLRTIHILAREAHGWSEFVDARPCQSRAEVERFYQRQGAYLALLYALNAVDLHYENLIAAGEDPVLIDLESLFHPQLRFQREEDVHSQLLSKMDASVLRIGLLPMRLWANEQSEGVDLSGLGGAGGQQTPRPVLQFVEAGTDTMHFVRKHVELPPQQNRPSLAGEPIHLLDYYASLIEGFEMMYRFLMDQKDVLWAGPLQAFAQDSIRVIVRPTNTYARLLHESTHPHILQHMLDRERFFDQLWYQVPAMPELKALILAEQEDLHAFDIPIFTTTPATRDIFTSKGVCIVDFCARPTLEQVKARLDALDFVDLGKQRWFIQAALATAQLRENAHPVSFSTLSGQVSPSVTRERLLCEASKVGESVEQMAFREKREAQWLNLSPVNERNWEIAPAGASLYNGTAGIALFLAYLGKLTGQETYRQLAEEAVRTMQKQIEPEQALSVLGAFSGWGGIIYLYTHLGSVWEEPQWFRLAEEIIERSQVLIEQDRMLDIMSGCAGYIAALLALDTVWPSPLAVATAARAGDYLLPALKKMLVEQSAAFGIEATRPLTGFSHGTAGIALSLLRLATKCGEAHYQDAAREAIAYERSVFSVEKQNWPDFRVLDQTRKAQAPYHTDSQGESYMTAWCHGAAGIGLARLASLPHLDDDRMSEEIHVAINTTLKEGFGWCHSLCHGDLGNLELLLTSRTWLNDQEHDLHVQRQLGAILAGMEQHGYVTGVPLGLEVPGLMVGTAGIGYAFLRAAYPELVPSVLTLEAPITKRERLATSCSL